jgi:hypothetical protein
VRFCQGLLADAGAVAGQRSHTALFVDFVDVETAQRVRGEVSGTALPGGLVVKAVNARPSQFERKTSDAGKSMPDVNTGSVSRGRTLAFTGFGGSKDTLRSLLAPYADAFNIRGGAFAFPPYALSRRSPLTSTRV